MLINLLKNKIYNSMMYFSNLEGNTLTEINYDAASEMKLLKHV